MIEVHQVLGKRREDVFLMPRTARLAAPEDRAQEARLPDAAVAAKVEDVRSLAVDGLPDGL
jgi:hypothetical protein